MTAVPEWVKKLTPSEPRGADILQQERTKSSITVDKFSELIHTKEVLERQDRLLKILQADPVFDKTETHSLGRVERIKRALAKGKRLHQLSQELQWSELDYQYASKLIGEPTPYGLHSTMFLITLRNQTTEEQKKLFLEPAERYEYIGCYAQTELGHGSNVRGLETTATWDSSDKTFIIHSPALTASKWWIGSLGKAANHAVVMAQLIVEGKNYGPHPFVVQIRDLKTHRPLENVYVGDVGPKFGYNTMDNGFLLFNHVKIPHINMLARFSEVDPRTNKFVRKASPALVYGTMTWVRSNIVSEAGNTLAQGVTIATRYCAVRRQFQDKDAGAASSETPVLDYAMVQARLLPLLATCYALNFTGKGMKELYEAGQSGSSATALADLHATSCGLKALSTTIAAEGLEMCRKTCGGHGYSSYSGIGPFYGDYLPNITWEGDNYMLTQQVARYLLKSARAVIAGKAPKNDTTDILQTYLKRRDIGCAFDVLDNDEDIVKAFAWRTAAMTFEALKQRDVNKRTWNSLLIDFWRLSTAHSQYMIVKSFHDGVNSREVKASLNEESVAVLKKLFRLHALQTLIHEASEFFMSGAVTINQVTLTRTKAIMALLNDIRVHAVALVDAWKIPDWYLDSSLGRSDGKVYEDLFKRASTENPLNDFVIDPYPWNAAIVKEAVPKSKL